MDCRRGRVRVKIAILKKVILSHTTVTIAIRWLSYHIRSIPISSFFFSVSNIAHTIRLTWRSISKDREIDCRCRVAPGMPCTFGYSDRRWYIMNRASVSHIVSTHQWYPDSFSSFTLGYDQGVASLRLMSSLVLHLKLLSNVYPTFIYNCVQSKSIKNSPLSDTQVYERS